VESFGVKYLLKAVSSVYKIQRQRGVLIVSVNRIKGTSEDGGKGKEGGERGREALNLPSWLIAPQIHNDQGFSQKGGGGE
jgi:hypothetical protein